MDGQQRLTALWRALHNNYENEKYFLYVASYDTVWRTANDTDDDETMGTGVSIHCQTRWNKADSTRMPLWADDPDECFRRGCIPLDLLRPEDIRHDIETWVNAAIERQKPRTGNEDFVHQYEQYSEGKKRLSDLIMQCRETVRHYNLPYLSLPSTTPKDVALQVFINMNTNSKPLTQYDIIVAEIEGVNDSSLHDLQAQRLSSHLIPRAELEIATYQGIEDAAKTDKIKADYEQFLATRATLTHRAVQKLVAGESVHLSDLFTK